MGQENRVLKVDNSLTHQHIVICKNYYVMWCKVEDMKTHLLPFVNERCIYYLVLGHESSQHELDTHICVCVSLGDWATSFSIDEVNSISSHFSP